MTPAQTAFVAALAIVLILVLGFAVVVIGRARRVAGGSAGLIARLGDPSTARLELHRWAFYAHRISGVAILLFLALHVVDVGAIAISTELYDDVHRLYGNTPMRVFEVGLLVGILFHALQGLRLLALDVVDVGAQTSERLLWLVVVLTVALSVPAAAVILAPVFG